ncbi:MAG: hypothetical protein JST21_07050 [Bacteroidetes bacterium]|nr:hypothetical protein [Bacteroidota bacterium]
MSNQNSPKKNERISLFKTDVAKIIYGMLLAFAFMYVYNNMTGSTESFTIAKSERISWDDAFKLKNEYLKFKPFKVRVARTPGVPGDTVEKKLEGFVFDAKQIDTIINHNVLLPAGEQADELILYFGQAGTFNSGILGIKRLPRLHIISAGIKDGKLLIDKNNTGDMLKSNVYDKADPCPPNCPK